MPGNLSSKLPELQVVSDAKTSVSDPLRIAEVSPGRDLGRIGITLCPGKKQPSAMTGSWCRDLDLDMDEIQRWGATAVITLLEDWEFDLLQVRDLPEAVRKRQIEWWHLPIPDAQPPGQDFRNAWTIAGEAIRDRLRLGFDVLVHCKGGQGRAGTVAARLLVELGANPEDAIREVRAARPGAIETCAQMDHVVRCAAHEPAKPSTSPESNRDRAIGAFLGLAVGDALGTTLEFSSRDAGSQLVDIVGGGPFNLPPGCWTDDTAMALALADSLAACDGLDCRDLMDRFVRWWRHGEYSCTGHCFDIGITIRRALERYCRTGDPCSGSTDPMTAGNGSLMRLAPVALRFWNDRARLRSAAMHSPERLTGPTKRWTAAELSRICSRTP